jgi:acyl-coenzyme A synthetase/AMP-(fatty) acid ligase
MNTPLSGKNWGTDVIPQERWIDPSKPYTCGGKRVIGLKVDLYNSAGQEVTYPVKGSVVVREKPLKLCFRIWSLDGRADVVWGIGEDLIPVEEEAACAV